MSDYICREPKGKRYKLSISQWNSKFACSSKWPFIYICLWVDNDTITVHIYNTIWAKLFTTLLYPVMLFTDGYKYANEELFRTWYNKKSGSFGVCIFQRRAYLNWCAIEELIGHEL